MRRHLMLLIPVMLVASCSSHNDAGNEQTTTAQVPKIAADQRAVLDKAKQVGDVAKQQAAEQTKQIDEASQ